MLRTRPNEERTILPRPSKPRFYMIYEGEKVLLMGLPDRCERDQHGNVWVVFRMSLDGEVLEVESNHFKWWEPEDGIVPKGCTEALRTLSN